MSSEIEALFDSIRALPRNSLVSFDPATSELWAMPAAGIVYHAMSRPIGEIYNVVEGKLARRLINLTCYNGNQHPLLLEEGL